MWRLMATPRPRAAALRASSLGEDAIAASGIVLGSGKVAAVNEH